MRIPRCFTRNGQKVEATQVCITRQVDEPRGRPYDGTAGAMTRTQGGQARLAEPGGWRSEASQPQELGLYDSIYVKAQVRTFHVNFDKQYRLTVYLGLGEGSISLTDLWLLWGLINPL